MTLSAPILEVTQVTQSFRSGFWLKRAQVLHSVSLTVPRGSVFGFLGPNGAGKTTLIQLIVGHRAPTSGSIKVAGYPALSREAKSRVGYLPERPYLYEHLTGEGILRYFGALSGMTAQRLRERMPVVLELVGLSEAGKRELRKYSKGMLQRIGIAQAILHEPEFLVLDEPMSGLDPVGRKEMRELIAKLAREGHTVFFSSHVIPDVEAICDQVALIQKGHIVRSGPVSEFLSVGGGGRIELRYQYEKGGLVQVNLEGQKALDELLPQIVARGGQVISVTPERGSLEDLFSTSPERSR
ncbi:ABC transporter ATP-binding protein [Bdellovibrionota bacterium FG-2]